MSWFFILSVQRQFEWSVYIYLLFTFLHLLDSVVLLFVFLSDFIQKI